MLKPAKYLLVRKSGDKSNDIQSSPYRTKRAVESAYAWWLRQYRKDPKYGVEVVRMGYFKYTYYGEYGTVDGEVYITRNN